jgi:imidazolonepropionase-like amidohydrolase
MNCKSWENWLGMLIALAVMTGGTTGTLWAQFGGGGAASSGGPFAVPGDGDHPYFAGADDVVAIRAGRLFDGTSDSMTYALNQIILIRGQDIVDIGPNVDIPGGATVIDLSDATVLPGMIDTHVHIMGNGSVASQWIAGVQSAEMALNAGFTVMVDQGSRDSLPWSTIEMRNAIMDGDLLGPRFQVTGPVVNPRGGTVRALPDFYGGYNNLDLPGDRLEIRGEDAARHAVRLLKIMGADWVKVYSTWDVIAPRGDMFEHFPGDTRYLPDTEAMAGLPALTDEEFNAIADEARRLGIVSTCHTYGIGAGANGCVNAGFDVPMHMMDADHDPALIRNIVNRGTSVQLSWNDAWTGRRNTSTRAVFRVLHEQGVALPFGSATQGGTWADRETNVRADGTSGVIGEGANIFPIFVEEGMTEAEALNTAFMVAAGDLNYNWADRLGSIETGKLADIIAVPGDPLDDISEMMNVQFVMRGGVVIRNDLTTNAPGVLLARSGVSNGAALPMAATEGGG